MRVVIDVMLDQGSPRPAAADPITLRCGIRDWLTRHRSPWDATGAVQPGGGEKLDTVTVVVETESRHMTAWAHVDVDRDGRIEAAAIW